MSKKIAIVTGGSSGIGLYTALKLSNSGYKVYEFSRRENSKKEFNHISVDVTDERKVSETIKKIVDDEGYIDILVNCAGFGISGAVEFTKHEDMQRQMEVNFFGMVNCNKAVLPYMRKRKSGTIVNISSVAAVMPIPFQTYYSASKAAINSYTCALRNEVKPYNVKVCAILPGDIATGFTKAREKSYDGDKEYDLRISTSVKKMEHDEENGISAQKAGDYVAKVAMKKNPKPLTILGTQYKILYTISKLLPMSFLNFVLGKMYA